MHSQKKFILNITKAESLVLPISIYWPKNIKNHDHAKFVINNKTDMLSIQIQIQIKNWNAKNSCLSFLVVVIFCIWWEEKKLLKWRLRTESLHTHIHTHTRWQYVRCIGCCSQWLNELVWSDVTHSLRTNKRLASVVYFPSNNFATFSMFTKLIWTASTQSKYRHLVHFQ